MAHPFSGLPNVVGVVDDVVQVVDRNGGNGEFAAVAS
jgi:hypothetical protein